MVNDTEPIIAALSGQLDISGNVVTWRSAGWAVSLQVIAECDLNGDGRADWLVWLSDEASDSSYRDYRTLIVFNVLDNLPLRAADLWPEAGSHLCAAP